MNSFPAVLESINDLSIDNINSLLSTSSTFLNDPSSHKKHIGKRLCSFFLENSTRTKFSFQIAAQNLGMHIVDVDPKKTSLTKGEDLRETFNTFYYQGIDILTIRSSQNKILSEFKNNSKLKLINAGDGTNEHPSQALLDLFSLEQKLKNKTDKKILIIGDIAHSRVASSLCKLLPKFNYQVGLIGPDYFLPKNKLGAESFCDSSVDKHLKDADAVYLLRVQNERHRESFNKDEYIKNYGLNLERLQGREIPIYHPGPYNLGVEISEDLSKSELYQGYQQVKNSVYMRMAIIDHMLGE